MLISGPSQPWKYRYPNANKIFRRCGTLAWLTLIFRFFWVYVRAIYGQVASKVSNYPIMSLNLINGLEKLRTSVLRVQGIGRHGGQASGQRAGQDTIWALSARVSLRPQSGNPRVGCLKTAGLVLRPVVCKTGRDDAWNTHGYMGSFLLFWAEFLHTSGKCPGGVCERSSYSGSLDARR